MCDGGGSNTQAARATHERPRDHPRPHARPAPSFLQQAPLFGGVRANDCACKAPAALQTMRPGALCPRCARAHPRGQAFSFDAFRAEGGGAPALLAACQSNELSCGGSFPPEGCDSFGEGWRPSASATDECVKCSDRAMLAKLGPAVSPACRTRCLGGANARRSRRLMRLLWAQGGSPQGEGAAQLLGAPCEAATVPSTLAQVSRARLRLLQVATVVALLLLSLVSLWLRQKAEGQLGHERVLKWQGTLAIIANHAQHASAGMNCRLSL